MKDAEEWFTQLTLDQSKLGADRWEYWQQHVLFSFNWWALLIFCTLGWVLWWQLVDKKRLLELLLVGAMIHMLATWLDIIGGELALWDYPAMVLPWGARLLVVDAVLPVFYMVLHQFSKNWTRYLIGLLGMSLVFAYVLEPLMIHVGVYRSLHWKHLFSVPGYMAIGVAARWLSLLGLSKLNKWQEGQISGRGPIS